jgi:ribosomal protein RSM22 (predicted rRNA methylase)
MVSFDTLPAQSRLILDSVPALVEKTFPMPGRFRSALPSQVAELSRLLTDGRGERRLSYLNRPNFLSAYLYYFLPWNLYRLCLLLPNLDLSICSGDTIIDMGSGPLTFACALWISRPDLRSLPLEFHCTDRSAPALEAGQKFFTAIAGNSPWKINLVKEDIDFRKPHVTRKKKTASLVCAVNMFNEIYENIPHNNTEGLKRMAANTARIMHEQAAQNAFILTVEPGVPRSGHFISFLRNAFLELGRNPLSPCPHTQACPVSGGKRWCHFAFVTADAPQELHRLSEAAGIPKERLVFSFLLTGEAGKNQVETELEKTRIISDAFPLPDNLFGRYGCCAKGLVLVTGKRNRIEKIVSGSLITPVFHANARDAKSGALIAEAR